MQQEAPLALEVFQRLPGPPATAAPPAMSASTDLVLEVGAVGAAAGARYYRCPLYLLQASCTALRDLLTDLLEGAMTEGTAAGLLPLPFVRPEAFEVVAAYVEHFYRAGVEGTAAPAPVSAPLRYEDLYDLSLWEKQYCLQHLLRLPQVMARRGVPYDAGVEQTWLRNGAWVDAMGSAPAAGAAAPPPSFTTEEKQHLAHHLLPLVEAATRLGVAPLQGLCAALVANLLVGQPEDQVRAVLARPGSRPLEPFTQEKRAALLQKHPWLDCSAA